MHDGRQHYQRLKTVPIQEVLPVVLASIPELGGADSTKKVRAEISGVEVKVSSLRMRCFAIRGIACSKCGLAGEFFAFEKPLFSKIKNESWHLNLYGTKGGEEVLFTHDHTLARALGGKDKIENVTTMCSPCNNEKSFGEGEERKRQLEQLTPLRSKGYSGMSPRDQWEEDKKHGYLDL